MESKPRFLPLSWDEIEELTLILAEKIRASGFKPDIVLGIMRGGWIPARILADFLGVEEIAAIEIKFYRGVGETRERPVVTKPPIADLRGRNVLVMDDVSDTGKSLSVAITVLTFFGPSSLKTATLFVKPWTMFIPDYYVDSTEAWIAFPWEKGELLEELASYARKTGEAITKIAKDELKYPEKLVERIARVRGLGLDDGKDQG